MVAAKQMKFNSPMTQRILHKISLILLLSPIICIFAGGLTKPHVTEKWPVSICLMEENIFFVTNAFQFLPAQMILILLLISKV